MVAKPLPSKVYVVIENAKSTTKARRVVFASWVRAYAQTYAKRGGTHLSVVTYATQAPSPAVGNASKGEDT